MNGKSYESLHARGLARSKPIHARLRVSRLASLLNDLRDARRSLWAARGMTATAFTILTLTMAATTVTFSVVDAVAIRPLPYAAPERLVGISMPGVTSTTVSLSSPQQYFDWLEGARSLESLAAARRTSALTLKAGDVNETLITMAVTTNLFDVLGVRPVTGRAFDPEHERPGGPDGVILSHALWVRRFGADPTVIGRRVTFGNGRPEVIGVLPAGVWYPITAGPQPDLYVPYVITAEERANDRGRSLSVVGRLRHDVSVEQARADLERVSMSRVVVLPLQDHVVGSAKTWLLLVLLAVGLVLLVACVNVASLFLARAATRTQELATRLALGASRRRLAVGLLLEGLVLAFASAAAAIAVSYWALGLAASSLPPGLTRVSSIAIDGRVLSGTVATALLCGLVFGSAPAWLAARTDLVSLMRAGGGPIIGGRRRDRALAAFLVADVAFVCVLLVATTLVVTSFVLITTADLGFDRRNVLTFGYRHSLDAVAEVDRPAAAAALRGDVLDRAKSVPGVIAVAISTNGGPPLSGGHVRYSISIPGVGEITRDDWMETRMVTPDYFRVMDMQLIRGRLFEPSDRAGAPLVMLINDVAARRFFPHRDPIGQVVTFRGQTMIIGVLRGVHFDGPEVEARPEMYTPADQEPFRRAMAFGSVLVRTSRDPRALAGPIRAAFGQALGGPELGQPRFVDDYFRLVTARRRFNAQLMSTFGIIALAIGALGIYGTMAFVVAQQVRAIGLRMALGASPSRVMRSVVWDALRRVGLGTGIGIATAWALSSALSSFVFGIRPTEPMVYVAVGSLLALVGIVAALVPALRASRLDPVTVMRDE